MMGAKRIIFLLLLTIYIVAGEPQIRNPDPIQEEVHKENIDFDRSVLNHESRAADFPMSTGKQAKPNGSVRSRGLSHTIENIWPSHIKRNKEIQLRASHHFSKNFDQENLHQRHMRHHKPKDRLQLRKFKRKPKRKDGRRHSFDFDDESRKGSPRHAKHLKINGPGNKIHKLRKLKKEFGLFNRRQSSEKFQKRRKHWRRRLGLPKRRKAHRTISRLDRLLFGIPRLPRDHAKRPTEPISSRSTGKDAGADDCLSKHCPPAAFSTLVCGSDDAIYSNECILKMVNCIRKRGGDKAISVKHLGICKRIRGLHNMHGDVVRKKQKNVPTIH